MSLTERLRKIEARLTALELAMGQTVDMVAQVADAVAADDADQVAEPQLTLDGEQAGAERDQSQSLDG